jgi:protein required for attachment to host cells
MPKRTQARAHEASAAIARFVGQQHAAASNVWVLVADRARARLFEFASSGQKLVEIACFDNPEARIHGMARDRLPRVNESSGGIRHAIEPRTTMMEKSVDRFARSLIDELENGRTQQRYDQLILVAPPRFRGALHRHVDKPLKNCISAEISRDLTTWPVERIFEQLQPRPTT